MTGNIISATKVEPDGKFENSAASGVWNLQDQYDYRRGVNWPSTDNPAPRALAVGGGNDDEYLNIMEYWIFATSGNAVDFGDLSQTSLNSAGMSSSTRGVINIAGGADDLVTYEYVTLATTGNTTDFGDGTVASTGGTAAGSSTRAVHYNGRSGTPNNTIEYITIASTGNATDFGDKNANSKLGTSASSLTRMVQMGNGQGPTDAMEYITIASTGNGTDFGNLGATWSHCGGASSSTRAVIGGGLYSGSATNTIEYITIASTGNATDFGNLSASKNRMGNSAASNGIVAHFFGGTTNSATDGVVSTIEKFTIATTGNATSFGNLTSVRYFCAGISSHHGGISA